MVRMQGERWWLVELPDRDGYTPDTPVRWARIGRDGTVEAVSSAEGEPWEPGDSIESRVIVIAPGHRAVLYPVPFPRSPRSRRIRALPFELEERISEPLESVAIEPGPDTNSGMVAAVASVEILEQWRQWCRDVGLARARLVPEMLPLQGFREDTLLDHENGGILFSPDGVPRRMPAELRDWARGRAGQVEPIEACAGWDGSLMAWVTGCASPEDWRNMMRNARTMNLLADDGPETASWRRWRVPAGLAAAAAVVATVGLHLENAHLENRLAAEEQRLEAAFSQALPDTRMVNPIVQVERALASDGDSAGEARGRTPEIAQWLGPMAEELARDELTVRSVEMERGRYDIALQADSVGPIEEAREALEGRIRGHVRLADTHRETRGVDARMRITEDEQ